VFLERGTLLDWGICRKGRNEIAVLDHLVAVYKPDVAVIEDPDAARCERRLRARLLLRDMAGHLRERKIAVVAISRREVRSAAAQRGLTTKHALAVEIGRSFPEIEHLVPPPRKPYDSEYGRAEIFDALSLVLHAFGIENAPGPESPASDFGEAA
jgi:hypothetical protein